MTNEEMDKEDHGAALLPADPSASPASTEALPNNEKRYVEVLRKITDDGMYCVLICAVDAPDGTVVAGDPNLRLAKTLREAADSILANAPLGVKQ